MKYKECVYALTLFITLETIDLQLKKQSVVLYRYFMCLYPLPPHHIRSGLCYCVLVFHMGEEQTLGVFQDKLLK
jgi:hypothetical protein